MLFNDEIVVEVSDLEAIKEKIPSEDFINEQYDIDCNVQTTDVLVILSTQRSGSTMLSGLLHKNKSCLAHEYFQPYEYMPIMAERWSCLEKNVLDKQAYIKNLIRYRTFANGWLGINLHGSHLRIFLSAYQSFSGLRMHYVHLMRRDVISQAISYEIAMQTGQWTNDFDQYAEPEYDYNAIRSKLEHIQKQDALIRAFIKYCDIPCQTIFYEDLVLAPEQILRTMPCIPKDSPLVIESGLKKQSSNRNKEWAQRFLVEFLDRSGLPKETSPEIRGSFIRRILDKVSKDWV